MKRPAMKRLWPLLLCALPAFAAVDGTVTNQTTGKAQAGVTVMLLKIGAGGMEPAGEVKTDAQGKFAIASETPGPALLQAVWEGVTYNQMLAPGAPTAGLGVKIYNTSARQPAEAKVTQHMILLEPAESQMSIAETYILANTGNVTWTDPNAGTLKFYLPPAAGGKVDVKCTAPQGMPVQRTAEKARGADTYKLDFAIKPGETRIDVTYAVPFAGGAYTGRIAMKDEATRLVTPAGVTLTGEKLTSLGAEPQSKANIYGLEGAEYSVTVTGTGALRAGQAAGGDAPADAADAPDSGPRIEEILPRINGNAGLIAGLALGILALGFALLYRSPESSPAAAARETNERSRR